MNNSIYTYGKQTIDQDDINAVIDVLKSDWLTQGPKIEEFENVLGGYFGSKYVSAVSNGTAGLHLIGLALGWSKDDIVITTPLTFLASANCIIYAGATPDFVDIDNNTYTVDVNKLEDKIRYLRKNNKNVKAVVAVDYAGHPCDWNALKILAEKYELQLVNDNCHALGAEYHGDKQYAVKYADVVNLSFHPVKHITTGEGGAVLTNSDEIDERIKLLRNHGVTKNEKQLEKIEGSWYYEMHSLGFNYRITDIQCALGISQLKKLDQFVEKRNTIANYYNDSFNNNERFKIPALLDNIKHAYHIYPLQIIFKKVSCSRKSFFETMKSNNILLQVHYIPIHLQPYYRYNYGFKEGNFPLVEEFYSNEVSIPIYPSLTQDDLTIIVRKIKEYAK